MNRWANVAISLIVGACSADESPSSTPAPDIASPDDVSSDGDDVAVGADVAATVDVAESGCSPGDVAACLYAPSKTWEFSTTVVENKIVYEDETGVNRTVNIALYVPKGAPTPMPVVLLSHGGADGKIDPLKSMEHWAPVFAKAGYLTVAIAHAGRSDASYDALCAALGTQADIQCGIKIHWDRPHDVKHVLDFLEQKASEADFKGLYDLDKVAHVGHSAGAGAALMSVGVTRNFVCAQPVNGASELQDCKVEDLVSLADDRIDVAVGLSPQGPGGEGFMDESYGAVTAPILMATGLVDGDGGEPANRLLLWPALPAGQKYKLFLNSEGAVHTLFEGSTDACVKHATEAECETMRSWVFSTGLAFVKSHLEGDPAATAWLASDDIVTAGSGVATFERK